MTTATALCVRCGSFPRSATPYLCDRCEADPRTRRDVIAAETYAPHDVIAQRRFVIERCGWAGGWGRSHPWADRP